MYNLSDLRELKKIKQENSELYEEGKKNIYSEFSGDLILKHLERFFSESNKTKFVKSDYLKEVYRDLKDIDIPNMGNSIYKIGYERMYRDQYGQLIEYILQKIVDIESERVKQVSSSLNNPMMIDKETGKKMNTGSTSGELLQARNELKYYQIELQIHDLKMEIAKMDLNPEEETPEVFDIRNQIELLKKESEMYQNIIGEKEISIHTNNNGHKF